MTEIEILKKAIAKAEAAGIEVPDTTSLDDDYTWYKCNLFIFSHSFAKAFWGEVELVEDPSALRMIEKSPGQKSWRYHLQQMVLDEDPIKYLEQFLNDKIN